MKMQGAGVAAVAAAGNQGEEKKTVNPELWHACAGPLVSIPPAGSLVVYFPQGHSEQVAASMRKDIDAHIPNYPNLPSEMICLLHNVTLHADPETDEVYAQMTLQPVNTTNKEAILASDLSLKSNKPQPEFFCKTLTASDTSTHGGFSVPRRSAEKIFPPLDYGMQPPAQELQARDLHDNVWTFRHIYRGQPKRHLLTTGWSLFVSGKRLLAGDSVLFIRDEKSQLLLGIRRANRQPTNIPSSVLSSDSMHIGILAAAAHAAANNSPFTVFYNPRTSPSEFVIPLAKYNKAIYGNHISVGMRFRMMFETEESGTRRYMGTITGISDLDPVRWKNSRWRNLQVGWDESAAGERRNRVSIWEIEPVLAPFFIYPPFFGSKRSRQPDDESQEMENLLKRVVPWLGEDVTIKDPLCQSGVMPGLSLVQWMNLQQSSLLANSNMQSLSGAGLQNLSAADLSRQLSLQAQALQKSNIQFNPQRPPQQAQQLEQLSKLAPQLKQLGGFPVSQEQLQDISMQRQTMVNQTGTYNQTQTPLSQTQSINPQMQQQQHASLVQTHQFPQSNVLPSHSQQITLQQQHQHQITLQQQHQQQMTLQQQHQQQMTLQQQQQQHQQQITLQQQQQQQHQQQITLQQQQQQHQQQITLQQQQQQLLQQQLLQQQKQLQANVPLQIPNQINQQLQMSEQQAQLQLLKKFQEQQKALQQEQSILCQSVLQHPQPTQEQRSKVLESSNHFANSNLHVQQNITKNSPVGVQFPSVQNQVQQKSQQAQVMTTELPNPGFQNPQINPLQRIGSCLPTSGARSVITDDIPSCSTSPSTNNGSSIPHKTANKIHSSLPCTDTMQLCTLTTGSTGNVETQIGNVKTTQELQKPASLVKPSVPIPKSQHTGTVAPQAYLGSGTQVDYLDSSSSATSNCISHSDVQLQQPIQYSSFNEQPIPFRDSSADVGIQTTDQRNNQFLFGVNIDDQLCVPMTSDHLLDKNIGQGKDCLNTITPGNMIENYNSKEVQQEISSSFVSQPFGVADVPFNSIESTVDDTSFLNKCSWAPPPQVQRMRTYTKVYKRGAVGRSIDIARYSGYDELKQDLIRMFSIGGQIEDLQRLGWKLVYVDHENDVLLVGDDPWEEFVGCVRSIKILSPQEVQQMSLDGDIGGNNSLPNQTCSSSDGGNVWRGQCDQNLGNTSTASYDHFH